MGMAAGADWQSGCRCRKSLLHIPKKFMQVTHQEMCFSVSLICLFDLLVLDRELSSKILFILFEFLDLFAKQWGDLIS